MQTNTKHELTMQEAADFLNVSRPIVIKEIEAERLKCREVNGQRRIEFEELRRYRAEQQRGMSRLCRIWQSFRKIWGWSFNWDPTPNFCFG